jgi:hypothetical protein
MAGKPAEPEPAGEEPGIEPAPHANGKPDDERIGPVAIARYVKDDGRALIVYTREPPAPPRPAGADIEQR